MKIADVAVIILVSFCIYTLGTTNGDINALKNVNKIKLIEVSRNKDSIFNERVHSLYDTEKECEEKVEKLGNKNSIYYCIK